MKMRGPILLMIFVCSTSFLPDSALAQFTQQGPKLVGTGAVGMAGQGHSVSISADGNTAIVGASFDNYNPRIGLPVGAAWIWTRSGGIWTQQGSKLLASDAVGEAEQGYSVSLSGDGNTAIIGGLFDNNAAGAAWIWIRSGGVWSEQAKLIGSGALGLNTQQGTSVALSADGNTAIVGGPVDNGGVGAAWVWTRSGGVWTQQGNKLVGSGYINFGTITSQGSSVSLSADGDTAMVGGLGDNDGTGAAWVWTRSGGVWTQQGNKLVGSGALGLNAQQGTSVSLSADGNTAMIGGPDDNNLNGSVWVWIRSGGVWAQQGPKLGASGFVPAKQGTSVSLSADGNTAMVGGPDDSGFSGATWVWTRSAGVWTQGAKLVGSSVGTNVSQGASVSLSANGTTAIIGGPGDNNFAGAAWVFAVPTVDLSVTKTDIGGPLFYAGGNLSYAISVVNNGPSNASSVTVSDVLPAGTTFVSATPSQGSCSGTSTVSCSLGTLANGVSATINWWWRLHRHLARYPTQHRSQRRNLIRISRTTHPLRRSPRSIQRRSLPPRRGHWSPSSECLH